MQINLNCPKCIVQFCFAESFSWKQESQNPVRVIIGHNVSLKWSYTLSVGENIVSIAFGREEGSKREEKGIGVLHSASKASVYKPYKGHMTFLKQNESSTLIIFKVNASDETKYFCRITTDQGSKKDATFLVILGE